MWSIIPGGVSLPGTPGKFQKVDCFEAGLMLLYCLRAIATRKLMDDNWPRLNISQEGCSKKVTMAIYVKKFTDFKFEVRFDLRGRFGL